MFSLQQSEDLVLDESNQQDLLADLHDHVPMEGNMNINHQANPSSSTADHGVGDGATDDHTNKKLIHRENEKQRRKQMANLYASLRNLLPFEFIKGKRSTPDQMEQTVKYIKHMQENIKLLGVKRDQLKNLTSMEGYTNQTLNLIPNSVVVNSCNGGVEILINSCSIQDGFVLSRVLKTLVEEGLNVISCISTRAIDRLLHTIQSEFLQVNNQASIDPSLLQRKLAGIANDWSNSN